MIQRLPIALAQVEAGNIWTFIKYNQKIIYFLYRAKEITKNVYSIIVNSINV